MFDETLTSRIHVLAWAISAALLPYTFLRKRSWFEGALMVFLWEGIRVIIIITDFPPNDWVGW